MKAFKGFNKDLTCRGFRYKVGETYEEKEAKLRSAGFHACESPVECLRCYNPATSVYHTVELDGISNEKSATDTTRVGKRITIGAEIGISEICHLTFDYVREHCTNEDNEKAGLPAVAGYAGVATAGCCGAAEAGDCGAAKAGTCGAAKVSSNGAAKAGDRGAAKAGYASAARAGDRGVAIAGGCGAATAGYAGAAEAGDCGAARAGNYGVARAGGCGTATAGYAGAAEAGDCGAARAGDHGAARAGDYGTATAGYAGTAEVDDYGTARAGDHGAARAGDYGTATAGYAGTATAGYAGTATSLGKSSTGINGLSVARGRNVRVKGGLGAVLVIVVERANTNYIQEIATAIVDGKNIKEDTWYKLENGKLLEADE